MYEDEFSQRLAYLRTKKGVSARDMSLSIGQNAGYINNIESGKAMPSMSCFFFICEYLNISPSEFFDTASRNPQRLNTVINDLKVLKDDEFEHICAIVKALAKK